MKLPAHQSARPFVLPENLQGLQILLVDDNPQSLRILKDLVERFGFAALSAESGEAALSMLGQTDQMPDLMIMDLNMTGKDGLETANAIRKQPGADFPIIIMTTGFGEVTVLDPQNPVIDGIIAKPVTASALLNAVMDAFAGKSTPKTAAESIPRTAENSAPPPEAGPAVLVVDDNRVNQEIAVEILKSAGIMANTASDGAEAVREVMARPYDAVLMDIHMPTMDGYEAVRKIREVDHLADLPILAMTASDIIQDESRCRAAGMNGFVSKPIRPQALFDTLGRFIRMPMDFAGGKTAKSPVPPLTVPDRPLSNDGRKADPSEAIDFRQSARDLHLDMEVYKKILSRFLSQNVHTMDHLRTAASQCQWKQLQSLAHNLRGSSGNIGAEGVKQAIEEIERLARDDAADPDISENIRRLLAEFEPGFARLLTAIKQAIQPESAVSGEGLGVQADPAQTREALVHLRDVLETADPAAVRTSLDRLKGCWSGPALQSIETRINEYDYDEAVEILTQTLRRLETDPGREI
jgi:CheY-like chemotaxis protein